MENERLEIRQSHITDYMWTALVRMGYVPTSDELLDFSDAVFCYITQFLLDNKIIEDVEYTEEVEEDE